MKVFISWSGQQSRDIAIELRRWLPYIIQPIKPFLSSGDIRSGKRWSDVLAVVVKAGLLMASTGIVAGAIGGFALARLAGSYFAESRMPDVLPVVGSVVVLLPASML
jgi:hypothetical protein